MTGSDMTGSDMTGSERIGSARDGESARRLLDWYDRHRRALPWRRDTDAYRVWVSEIMLQQTRVETVIPYYERFLEHFPSVTALAEAPVDEVLARWSGLGYYRRARQLHAAAQVVVAGGGEMPVSAAELERLPGIGSYTAAAVASIAFGEVVAVLDGNVERVISRLLASEADAKKTSVRRGLAASAARLLDPRRPGDGNQALMELGATVCTPTRPRCGECPLAAGCRGLAAGDPERYPPARVRRAPVRLFRRVAVVFDGDRLLLFRRPDDAELLAGTWELPWVEGPADEFLVAEGKSLAASERALGERYGGSWRLAAARGTVRHSITYRAITLEVRGATVTARETVAEGPEAGLFTAAELDGLALSSQVRKVLAKVVWPVACE